MRKDDPAQENIALPVIYNESREDKAFACLNRGWCLVESISRSS